MCKNRRKIVENTERMAPKETEKNLDKVPNFNEETGFIVGSYQSSSTFSADSEDYDFDSGDESEDFNSLDDEEGCWIAFEKQVTFSDDVEVILFENTPEEKEARTGFWAEDNVRFAERCKRLEQVLKPILEKRFEMILLNSDE